LGLGRAPSSAAELLPLQTYEQAWERVTRLSPAQDLHNAVPLLWR